MNNYQANQRILGLALLFTVNFCGVNFAGEYDDGWGNLKGRIRVVGDRPTIQRETIDKDQPTCLADRDPPPDDNILISKDGGLADVFVMIYLKPDDPKPAVHTSYQEPAIIELDNLNCRFTPHALFVRTGQILRLKNSDDVGHNCHIVLLNSEENVNIPIGEHVDVKFTDAEKVPGNVVCDIHKWMDAVLLVREEPYVAISNPSGEFEIKNIPVGEWEFQFWHKKIGYLRSLKILGKKVGRRGEITVQIENKQSLDLGTLEIDGKDFRK